MRAHGFCVGALCASLVACGGEQNGGSVTSQGRGGAGGGGATTGAGAGSTSSGAGGSTSSTSSASSSGGGSSSGSGTSSGSGAGGSGTGTGTGGGNGAGGATSGLFEAPNAWTKAVDAEPKNADSDAIIGWLDSHGGWGTGSLKIDFSITVLTADASTPMKAFTPTGDFFSPDCDQVPFPVPAGGALEDEQGYECTTDGDCHLIVVHEPTKKLYEMWRANISGGTFYGGCGVVWDLTKSYPPNLRGEGCTSADAGGFPIAAMLFSADEVAAGEVPHAIRFILPNSRIRANTYVHPGTHTTGATSGGASAPPYGVRLRLRADFPMASLPSDGARIVAKGLQKYGMLLADAGNIALTARDDRFTTHKWDEVGIDAQSLTGIQVTDMEVVDMGAPIDWNGDCVRNP